MKKVYSISIISLVICILFAANFYGIKGNMYILLRNIPRIITELRIKDYNTIYTENFIIRHKSNDEEMLSLLENTAEKFHDKMYNDFNYHSNKRPTIIFYESTEELLRNANLGESKPPMGVYYASTIHILSPRLWNTESDDIEYMFTNEGPMVHEITHLIVDDITKGNYPLWFTEGIALYQEYDKTGYEWGKDVKFDKIYNIDELDGKFGELNQYLAYTQSFRMVKYIVEKYGHDSLMEILRLLRAGDSFERAFERATQSKIEVLEI